MKYLLALSLLLFSINVFCQDFYKIDKINNIDIQFKDKNWDKKLDSLMNDAKSNRLVANVTIDKKPFKQIGVRYKGNSSYNNVRNQEKSKLPLNLESDTEIKKQNFQDEMNSIKLSNMFRDPSCIREVLAYWFANQLFPAPKANFAKVTVNKKYLGVYTNTESLDAPFLKQYFGTKKGVFIKCDPNWDSPEISDCPKGDKAALLWQGTDSICYEGNYELKSKQGYKELINLIAILNKQPDKIEKLLDVDKTLWMHAFNHTIVNLDSYTGRLSHNYYLFRDTSEVFVPLVWDMNLAFGGFRLDEKKILTEKEMFNYPLTAHFDDPNRPLISNLYKNPIYYKIYLSHCKYIYDNFFANDLLEKKAVELSKFIEPEIKKDGNNLYSYNDFKQNLEREVKVGNVGISGITELLQARKTYLAGFFKDKPSSKIDSVYFNKDSTNITIHVKARNLRACYLFYKNQQQPRFYYVQMQEDLQNPGTSDQKSFVYQIPAIEKTKYFVVAESEKTAQVYPEKASISPIIIPD